jgi:hypothetical protein
MSMALVFFFCLCVDVNSANYGMKWVNNRNKKRFFLEAKYFLKTSCIVFKKRKLILSWFCFGGCLIEGKNAQICLGIRVRQG